MLAVLPALRVSGDASRPPRRRMGNTPAKHGNHPPGTVRDASHSPVARRASRRLFALADGSALAPAGSDVLPEQAEAQTDAFAGNYGAIMLQGFHWRSCSFRDVSPEADWSWYEECRRKIAVMRSFGVSAVWLPPPSHSVSPEGYLPQRLYDLDTRYGTKAELKQLTRALWDAGIAPLADVVINHRCADTQDADGKWRVFSNVSFPDGPPDDAEPGALRDKSWGPWAIVKDDPHFEGEGESDTGESFAPAPDLDHKNGRVRAELTAWLNWLRKDVGFRGWRFDYVKGYGANYVREYVENSVGTSALCVAEFWPEASWDADGTLARDQNPMRQALCDWIDRAGGTTPAFDFTTKAVLQEAVGKTEYWRLADERNEPPGLIGWWPERAVTFVDNHDTGEPQNHWPFPADRLALGYAYILTHPGIPCVFGPHLWDENDPVLSDVIKRLIDLRRRCCVCPDARVRILMAEDDLYVAKVGKMLTVKLGPRFEMPVELLPNEPEWSLAVAGEDFAVWERVEYQSEPVAAMEEKMRDVGDDGEYYPLEPFRKSIGSWIEPPARNVEPSDGEADPR